jgi:hypothetical protein
MFSQAASSVEDITFAYITAQRSDLQIPKAIEAVSIDNKTIIN